MIVAKTRKWGNSLGIVLPKEEVDRLRIKEDEEVVLELSKKTNPLKELYNAGYKKKIGVTELKKMRREWESQY